MSFLAPVGSTTIYRLTRHVFAFRTKGRNVKRIEKKKEEKVSRPRSRRGPSMKRSFTVHVRYAVIKREVYETRNRETGPDDVKRRARCRGCSWHPRNVDPGRGHFYLSLAYARNFSGEPHQPLPFSVISIELRIPVRSLILFYRLLSFVMTVLSLFSVLRPREFDFLRLQIEYI